MTSPSGSNCAAKDAADSPGPSTGAAGNGSSGTPQVTEEQMRALVSRAIEDMKRKVKPAAGADGDSAGAGADGEEPHHFALYPSVYEPLIGFIMKVQAHLAPEAQDRFDAAFTKLLRPPEPAPGEDEAATAARSERVYKGVRLECLLLLRGREDLQEKFDRLFGGAGPLGGAQGVAQMHRSMREQRARLEAGDGKAEKDGGKAAK